MKQSITLLLSLISFFGFSNKLSKYHSLENKFILQKHENLISRYFNGLEGYSQTGIKYSHTDIEGIYNPDNGNKQQTLEYNIFSEYKTDNSIALGSITYTEQEKENIKWNLIDDNEIFAPYTIASDQEYTQFSENYFMNGAYAIETGDFIYGINTNVNSKISYGKIEPRPKNVIFKYNFDLFVAYNLASDYYLNPTVSYYNYSLINSVRLFSKNNNEFKAIVINAFGVEDKIYSQKERSLSPVYRGEGAKLGLNFFNKREQGFELYSDYTNSEYNLEYNVNGDNYRIFKEKKTRASGVYKFKNELIKNLVFSYNKEKKSVTETSIPKDTKTILRTENYFRITSNYELSTLHKFETERSYLEIIPSIGYTNYREDYQKPTFYHYTKNLHINLKFNYFKDFSNSSLLIYTALFSRHNLSNDLSSNISNGFINQQMYTQKIEPNQKLVAFNFQACHLKFRYDYNLNSDYALFSEFSTLYQLFEEDTKIINYSLSLGFSF